MIDIKKLLTKILRKLQFTPVLLDGTKYACTGVGTTFEYTTITGLEEWHVIAVYFVVHEEAHLVYFTRPLTNDISYTASPPSGYYRGTIKVDWANDQIGIRCISAGTSGTNYNLVFMQGVYGIA